MQHEVVSNGEWLKARKALLAKEKQLNRLRDELSEARRDLPWEKVEKDYAFDGPHGKQSLADLFGDKSQLEIYHFMFAPDWDVPCKSCSFWADNFNGVDIHLKHRDIAFAAISRAPFAKLAACRQRMGWNFDWLSSGGTDFNFDYHVSFRPEDVAKGEIDYNYRKAAISMTDLPGISVFAKDETGNIFHTYSSYSRGVDMVNGAYHWIDLTPKGRDEDGKGMFWLKRHDEYDR